MKSSGSQTTQHFRCISTFWKKMRSDVFLCYLRCIIILYCMVIRDVIGENIAFAGVKNAFRRSEVNDNAMTSSNNVNIATCQKRKRGLQTKQSYNKQISSWKVSANGIFALVYQEFAHSFASLNSFVNS